MSTVPLYTYNYSTILPFERGFDPKPSTLWMQNHWMQSVYLSIVYVLFIFGGQRYMAERVGYKLKAPLVAWNAALAIFSIMGCIRFTPDFFYILWNYGFHYSICVTSYAQGVPGFWTEMFALSKALELFDTMFIVLRKRQLIFLHWYHHITVLIESRNSKISNEIQMRINFYYLGILELINPIDRQA